MPFPGCDYIYEASANYKEILRTCNIGTWLIRESASEEGVLCISRRINSENGSLSIESTRFYFNGCSWGINQNLMKDQPVYKKTMTQEQYGSFLFYIKNSYKPVHTGNPYNHEVLEKAEKMTQELAVVINEMKSKKEVERNVKENFQPSLPFKDFVHSTDTLISNFNNNSLLIPLSLSTHDKNLSSFSPNS